MESLRIEPLRPKDREAARDLILRGLEERYGALDTARNPDLVDVAASYAAGRFLVARAGGAVVGTGAWLPLSSEAVRIHRMSVALPLRERGIGSRLLAHLLDDARGRGFLRAVVETTDTWTDAIAFYERRGFRRFDRRPGELFLGRELGAAPAING